MTSGRRSSMSINWRSVSPTETGKPATTRGASLRPAFSAAALIVGTVKPFKVFGPTIQVTVPSAKRPARPSMAGASAARSTWGGGAGGMPSFAAHFMVSPV